VKEMNRIMETKEVKAAERGEARGGMRTGASDTIAYRL
jgi:hypothetical protein